MKKLTKEQLLLLHEQLIDRYGGMKGIRDEFLLDSALNAPYQSYDSYEFYPTVIQKATRLCYGLVMDHPFFDGNKRIGALALLVTLDLNQFSLLASNDELSKEILQLAAGTITYEAFYQWVQEHLG